jgi:predicted metal-binding protein
MQDWMRLREQNGKAGLVLGKRDTNRDTENKHACRTRKGMPDEKADAGREEMLTEEMLMGNAIQYGAYKAFVIDVDKISFDEDLRSYCTMNYCGSFGKNYACPPDVGTVGEVIGKAMEYKKALVFQTIGQLEDSYDFEGMQEAADIHTKVSDRIDHDMKLQSADYLQLTVGGCTVCKVCAIADKQPCRFPDRAVSSLEAYCMNVSNLAKLCDMKYINGKDTVTYFGAFLYR